MKISPKFIIVLTAALRVIIGAALYVYSSNSEDTDGRTLAIYSDGEKVTEYSLSELMKLESETVYAEIHSSGSADEEGEYEGVRLSELLESAGVGEYETAVLTAGDGYSSAAKASEADDVLIAYSKDGETLGYYTSGGSGPIRAVFLEDAYGNRSVMYLIKISCK